MQPLSNDATTALLRALRARFGGAGCSERLIFEDIRSRAWASVTFTGARHELALLICGDDAERAAAGFSENLDLAEFRMRGHILADIALASREPCPDGVRLRLEALTVEE
jgi:hypothetical protein